MPNSALTLAVVDPGHFHAALTLREIHPRLAEDVYVYSEDCADLERFLSLVQSFNQRPTRPTRWRLHVYRGADWLVRACEERRCEIAVVAGRNDRKLAAIAALQAAGIRVLGDKPWLIDAGQLAQLRSVTGNLPMAMDIMTERRDVANQLARALTRQPGVFDGYDSDSGQPAIQMRSTHHLYKLVNERPLIRPAWYFDTACQGRGITDVTTHLVDLCQWLLRGARTYTSETELRCIAASQWPTPVPRSMYERITATSGFASALDGQVRADTLELQCNGSIDFEIRDVAARVEALWDLAIPENGGDTHEFLLRGRTAEIRVWHAADTGFATALRITPRRDNVQWRGHVADAMASMQAAYPGVAAVSVGPYVDMSIPAQLRTTHEQNFATVLDEFIGLVDGTIADAGIAADLLTKYTLLATAATVAAGAAMPV